MDLIVVDGTELVRDPATGEVVGAVGRASACVDRLGTDVGPPPDQVRLRPSARRRDYSLRFGRSLFSTSFMPLGESVTRPDEWRSTRRSVWSRFVTRW